MVPVGLDWELPDITPGITDDRKSHISPEHVAGCARVGSVLTVLTNGIISLAKSVACLPSVREDPGSIPGAGSLALLHWRPMWGQAGEQQGDCIVV